MEFYVEGIAAPFKKEVIDAVESIQEMKVLYIDKNTSKPGQLLFNAETEDAEAGISIIKKAIKSSKRGRLIAFRVVKA